MLETTAQPTQNLNQQLFESGSPQPAVSEPVEKPVVPDQKKIGLLSYLDEHRPQPGAANQFNYPTQDEARGLSVSELQERVADIVAQEEELDLGNEQDGGQRKHKETHYSPSQDPSFPTEQKAMVKDLNEAKRLGNETAGQVKERWMGEKGVVEGALRAKVLGEIDEPVQQELDRLGMAELTASGKALSPENQRLYLAQYRQNHRTEVENQVLLEKVKAETGRDASDVRDPIKDLLKKRKADLLATPVGGSTGELDLQAVLKQLTNEKDESLEKNNAALVEAITLFRERGQIYLTDSLAGTSFDRLMDTFFGAGRDGASGGIGGRGSVEKSAEKTVDARLFEDSLQKPKIFGEAVKNAFRQRDNRLGLVGFREYEDINKVADGDLVAIREQMILMLRHMFSGTTPQERDERFDAFSQALGDELFRGARLSEEVKIFLKEVYDDAEKLDKVFPVAASTTKPTEDKK